MNIPDFSQLSVEDGKAEVERMAKSRRYVGLITYFGGVLLLGILGYMGAGASGAFQNASGGAFIMIFVAFIVGAVATAPVRKANRAYVLSLNYDRYIKDHPEHAPQKNNGKVKCYKCGSDRIGTQRLMNKSFLMQHFCNQCGEKLYYSPEVPQ